MRQFLQTHALPVTLGLAALVVLFLSGEMVSESVMPYTDGNHYVQRAFALYGFLHTGQWAAFWNLFTLPRQTLLPPQDALFFLLPRSWATLSTLGSIQLLCNFGVLSVAVWNLCRVFRRPEWAPALLLFSGCENYSFDYPFFFFLDLTFCAFSTLALSFQVAAWRTPTPRIGAAAGATLGLLFWLKPANALLFSGIYCLSEILYWGWNRFSRPQPGSFRELARRAGWFGAGFVPVLILAWACGAGQSILLLLDRNELTPEWETHLPVTGLLRFFYFPLCFAYFYHVIVLLLLVAGLLLFFRDRKSPPLESRAAFPITEFFVLMLSFAIFGEVFSFWILVKTMRSLVFLLPVLWLFLFWLAEQARLRGPALLGAALCYLLLLSAQVMSDAFQSLPLAPDKFYLTGNWYASFPMAWPRYDPLPPLVTHLQNVIARELPQGGRVGVSTERVFLDGRSLALRLNGKDLLDGRPPRYSCVRLFNPEGRYSPAAFCSANVIVLYLAKNAQYSQFTWREATNLLAYIPDHWAVPPDIVPVQSDRGRFLGYLIRLRQFLTPEQVQEAMQRSGAPGPMLDDGIDDYLYGMRYSWADGLELLRRWAEKRLGFTSAREGSAASRS